MGKVNISPLLYAIVASGIAWFFLWFAYDVMRIWHFLKPLTFANLGIVICLIAFVIFGGIEQLKNLLKEMRKKNARRNIRNFPRLRALFSLFRIRAVHK